MVRVAQQLEPVLTIMNVMVPFRLPSDGRLLLYLLAVHFFDDRDEFGLVLLRSFDVLLHEGYPHDQVIYFVRFCFDSLSAFVLLRLPHLTPNNFC